MGQVSGGKLLAGFVVLHVLCCGALLLGLLSGGVSTRLPGEPGSGLLP